MLSRFSVKKPYTVIVSIIFVLILGFVSFVNMSTELLPNINLPYAVINTTYIGGSPEEVEMYVTRPIEQRMASIGNVQNINSTSRENFSSITLEFNEKVTMDSAIIEIRENLDMIRNNFPENVSNPSIMKLNPDMMPIMILSVALNNENISDSSPFIESTLIPDLESVEGVASISATGLLENEIEVIINPDNVQEINHAISEAFGNLRPFTDDPLIEITPELISTILKGQNFSMPIGYFSNNGTEYLLRIGEDIKDIEELKNLTIIKPPIPNFDAITLSDVADIQIKDMTKDHYSKVNGNDAVILQIQKQGVYATTDITKNIDAKIKDIQKNNENVEIVTLMNQGEYIGLVVDSITINLIFGGLLAILILFIFLKDVRPTFIVAFSIPISVVTAFVIMYFSGITLNLISMGGLALGVGMLVDNSIVVIENIYRMRTEGKTSKEAAIKGTNQVSGAILSSTLTTISVFLPIVFTQGLTRQLFTDMGLTITYSLIASLLIALTFVPMFASNLFKKETKKEMNFLSNTKNIYTKLLNLSIRYKFIVIFLVVFLFAISILGSNRIGSELFPPSDSGQLSATLNMPKGSSFEETISTAEDFLNILSYIKEIETLGASIDGNMTSLFSRGTASNKETVNINILLKKERDKSTSEVRQLIRETTRSLKADITIREVDMNMSSISGSPVSIDIFGRDFDTLTSITRDITHKITAINGIAELSTPLDDTSKELKIVVNKDKSIEKGFTIGQIHMKLLERLSEPSSSTTVAFDHKTYDIIIKETLETSSVTASDLENITIGYFNEMPVKLNEIATLKESEGFSSINRLNQQRYMSITGQLEEGYNVGLVNQEIANIVDDYLLPQGYTIALSGENEMITESFNDLYIMLLLGVAFIYLIMVSQFQSLLSPFIVMFTIPLAFTGGFFALIVTNTPMSIISLIGLIILTGIVVNNGIVFIDYINKLRTKGLSKNDAIIKAGNDRLRPIMMTALTTIIALSTLSLGTGQGTEMIQPMAITAIGGLIYSTLLTLIFIPVLYDIFHKNTTS